jgi:hypothetical protein
VPIQVILTNQLIGDEKLWLGSLRDNLTAVEMAELVRILRKQDLLEECKAFLYVILKENASIFKEVFGMGSKELRDVLEKVGLTEEWRLEGKTQVAIDMIKDGISLQDISKYTKIPVEKLAKVAELPSKDKPKGTHLARPKL